MKIMQEKTGLPSLIIGIDASRAARLHRTGTETYSLAVINALASMTAPGLRLRLYTPHPPQHSAWPASPYVETRIIPLPRLWTHLRLAAELKRQPPELLFVPAHVLPLYCSVPAVVTVHDVGYRHYPEAHPLFNRLYLDWTTRRHCCLASHIIAVSQATKQDLITFYGADPDRITVILSGRDESLTAVTDRQIIAQVKLKYNIEGDYLLYLGTIQPRKNLSRLIEAFHTASYIFDRNLKLVIAGKKGWLYNDIFEQVRRLGLENRVLFTGYVADEDKAALLSGALAYLFPSLYEGFGLPVLEAMACGTPVLTSKISSLPEVAGQAALLVDPLNGAEIAAGLIELVTNSSLRHQLVEGGYKQVKKFSWQKTAIQTLEILKMVATKLCHRPPL